MSKLTVEVKGIGFPNKGAELMLVAIIEQFKQRGVDARFAVEPYGDYQLRAYHGLYQKARVTKFGVDIGALVGLMPNKLLNVFGIVKSRDIDVVLDASGFSYGDQWGPKLVDYRLGTTIESLKKQGKKVVLLPQALGPFEDEATKKSAQHIFSNANLVFARDPQSYSFAQPICGNTELQECPDFTNLVEGTPCNLFDAEQHEVCVIPNTKMLEKTKLGDEYVDFLVNTIENVNSCGKKPFLLVHEGKADRELAEKVATRCSHNIDILEPIDPLKIKWVIGQSRLVISSRFHGLVSALSQGVPVIATGWSHKYQCLLKDYDVFKYLVDTSDQEATNKLVNDLLADEEYHQEVTMLISKASLVQKQKVIEMWNKVFDNIS
ncbi:polysaccharide pyruvyl transferase family protein [Vibrio sp. IB15]|uniref:polysaccharide pyruvyl transferase family protein n=1 Tax=Vibrio sp. IB15 TaxID=2779368 RepID=UPI0018E7E157|nr:polysaccharide pyruvyl transferase family protein [Vibrio sp. IB15]MBJ2145473.1 polysaccharide pyruvyl transferase family protein [Vibrio sp. IB15]